MTYFYVYSDNGWFDNRMVSRIVCSGTIIFVQCTFCGITFREGLLSGESIIGRNLRFGWVVRRSIRNINIPPGQCPGHLNFWRLSCFELIHFWWSLNKSLASVIPQGENLSVIYPLFISWVFNIATDKCLLNDFFAWKSLLFILQCFSFQSMAV